MRASENRNKYFCESRRANAQSNSNSTPTHKYKTQNAKTQTIQSQRSYSHPTGTIDTCGVLAVIMACQDFIIHSQGRVGYVEVCSSDTLFEVRRLVSEEFDPEQLPSFSSCNNEKNDCAGQTGSYPEFAFRVNGIWISSKQECHKNAFELLERKVRVELVPKKQQQSDKRSAYELLLDNDDNASENVKCARMVTREGEAVTTSLHLFLQQKDDDATEEERVSKLESKRTKETIPEATHPFISEADRLSNSSSRVSFNLKSPEESEQPKAESVAELQQTLLRLTKDICKDNPARICDVVGMQRARNMPRGNELCYNTILGNPCKPRNGRMKCKKCKDMSKEKSNIDMLTQKELQDVIEMAREELKTKQA